MLPENKQVPNSKDRNINRVQSNPPNGGWRLRRNTAKAVQLAIALGILLCISGCNRNGAEPGHLVPTVTPAQEETVGVDRSTGTRFQGLPQTPTHTPRSTLPTPTATPCQPDVIDPDAPAYYPCGGNERVRYLPLPYEGTGYRGVLQWNATGTGLIYDHDGAIYTVDIQDQSVFKVVDANPGDHRRYTLGEFPYGFYGSLSPDGAQVV